MSIVLIIALIILSIILLITVLVAWLIKTKNLIIVEQEKVFNAKGQIAAQTESRWDALTSLISATKEYAEHESKVLMEITSNRSGITKDFTSDDIKRDDKQFEKALSEIKVVMENYPDLKASTVFIKTMDSIESFENNVRHSRMIFNDTVSRYNRLVKIFPNSIVANIWKYKPVNYLDVSKEKTEMPSW